MNNKSFIAVLCRVAAVLLLLTSPASIAQGANGLSTTSPTGVKHTTPVGEMFSAGSLWGVIAEVQHEEESIFANADISRSKGQCTVPATGTIVNVVRRLNATVVELGVGTKLQVAMGDATLPGQQQTNKPLPVFLGCPGNTITIQPSASIRFNDMDFLPLDGQPVTFVLGEKNGVPAVKNVTKGRLGFRRTVGAGAEETGELINSEGGVIEKLAPRVDEEGAWKKH